MIDGKTVVCLGGTFNRIHAGHRLLFKTAFEAGDLVFVGVASDSLVRRLRRERAAAVRPFAEREADVKRLLAGYGPERATVSPLDDPYMPSKRKEFDVIVVSPETRNTAEEINALRGLQGFEDIKIVEVPHLLAFDGKPISSTRILAREIDEDGRPAPSAARAAAPAAHVGVEPTAAPLAAAAPAGGALPEVAAAPGAHEEEAPAPGALPAPSAATAPETPAPARRKVKRTAKAARRRPPRPKPKGARKPAKKAAPERTRSNGKKGAAKRGGGRSKARKGSRASGRRSRR